MYTVYFDSLRQPAYNISAVLPESPLFCPRDDFFTLHKSPRASPDTMELLQHLRQVTNLFTSNISAVSFGAHTPSVRLNSSITAICEDILRLPPPVLSTEFDGPAWTFEACRLAAIIYATSLKKRIAFSKVIADIESSSNSVRFVPSAMPSASSAPPTSLLAELKRALKESDACYNCWDDMMGVLFWVALVGATAAKNRPERRWFAAVAVRCSILLGFDHGYAVMATLRNMLKVMEKLRK